MAQKNFSTHFENTLQIPGMFSKLRAIFPELQNGRTTCLKDFIDEKRKSPSFYKKRRG